MANIFGILTAVLLALAAFVASKNKGAYQNEVDHRKAREADLVVSRARLKTAQTTLKNTEEQLSTTRTEVAKLKETEAGHKKTNEDLKSQIATKTAERDTNKTNLSEIEAKLADLGNIKELVSKVQNMASSIEESKQAIAANESKLANLNNDNNRTEALIKKLKDEGTMFSNRQSYFRSASISSIYPSYGFVTLAAGSVSGVVSGSTLDVVRDGQIVAKLLVSGVESNHSTASIIPDSLVQDTVLMVGDKVQPSSKPLEPAPAPKPVADPGAKPAAEPDTTPSPAEEPPAAPDDDNPFGDEPADKPAADKPAADTPAADTPAAEPEVELPADEDSPF